jgi:hypothetical protein
VVTGKTTEYEVAYTKAARMSVSLLSRRGRIFLTTPGHHDISLDLGNQVLIADSVHSEEQEVAYDDL